MASALPDLHVLDFSRVLAGPFATMLLADLGATVTKVERPGTGDDTRTWGPPWDPSTGEATYFLAVNRGKRSVVLDLATEAGRAAARRLAADADVVVENFRPGLMEELGLGYEDLRAVRPDLIFCSITGFGRAAGAALPGYDLLLQALGGLMSVTGAPDGPPQKAGVAVVDVLAGLFAAVGVLAAVRHRDRTGEGQRVDVDLLSSLLSALVNQATAYTAAGEVPERLGNAHPSVVPYEPLRCADGDLVVAVGNDAQFVRLCDAVGLPELAGDPRFATNGARVRHRDTLIPRLEAALATDGVVAWEARLAAARVPAGRVQDVAGAFALAERLGLDPVVALTRADGTEARVPRNPIGLSLTPVEHGLAPPRLGESGKTPESRSGMD